MQILIVNFHYIRNIKPEVGIYPRTPAEFKDQIEELGRYYDFISQEKLLGILKDKAIEGSDSRYCLITFDDNLKEQLLAYEYLKEQGIPAVFYSTTLPYIEKQVHDVHKTHEIYAKYSERELVSWLDKSCGFNDYTFSEQQLNLAYSYDTDVNKKIKIFLNFVLSANEKKIIIDQMFNEIIIDVNNFRDNLYFSKEELRMIAQDGMLGTHTHSHLPLASISLNDAIKEISISYKYLEKITGTKIRSISYPYGRHGAINKEVSNLARSLGLEFGLTMYRGVNNESDLKNNPMLLKRVDTNDAPHGKNKVTEFYPNNINNINNIKDVI